MRYIGRRRRSGFSSWDLAVATAVVAAEFRRRALKAGFRDLPCSATRSASWAADRDRGDGGLGGGLTALGVAFQPPPAARDGYEVILSGKDRDTPYLFNPRTGQMWQRYSDGEWMNFSKFPDIFSAVTLPVTTT